MGKSSNRKKQRAKQRATRTGAPHAAVRSGKAHQHPVGGEDIAVLFADVFNWADVGQANLGPARALIGAAAGGCRPCQDSLIPQILNGPADVLAMMCAFTAMGPVILGATGAGTMHPATQGLIALLRADRSADPSEYIAGLDDAGRFDLLDDSLDTWAASAAPPEEAAALVQALLGGSHDHDGPDLAALFAGQFAWIDPATVDLSPAKALIAAINADCAACEEAATDLVMDGPAELVAMLATYPMTGGRSHEPYAEHDLLSNATVRLAELLGQDPAADPLSFVRALSDEDTADLLDDAVEYFLDPVSAPNPHSGDAAERFARLFRDGVPIGVTGRGSVGKTSVTGQLRVEDLGFGPGGIHMFDVLGFEAEPLADEVVLAGPVPRFRLAFYDHLLTGDRGDTLPGIGLIPEGDGDHAGYLDRVRMGWKDPGRLGQVDFNWRLRMVIGAEGIEEIVHVDAMGYDDVSLWRCKPASKVPEAFWDRMDRAGHALVVGPVPADADNAAIRDLIASGAVRHVVARGTWW